MYTCCQSGVNACTPTRLNAACVCARACMLYPMFVVVVRRSQRKRPGGEASRQPPTNGAKQSRPTPRICHLSFQERLKPCPEKRDALSGEPGTVRLDQTCKNAGVSCEHKAAFGNVLVSFPCRRPHALNTLWVTGLYLVSRLYLTVFGKPRWP